MLVARDCYTLLLCHKTACFLVRDGNIYLTLFYTVASNAR